MSSSEQQGSVLRGEQANLSVVRAAAASASGKESLSTALQQLLDVSKEERILHDCISVEATLTSSSSQHTNNNFEQRFGTTVITSERVLFWADEDATATNAASDDDDLVIDATCIDLHAVSQDPVTAVYLQVSNGEDDLLELTLAPRSNKQEERETHSQSLFDALSQLISLHPIDPNEEDGEGFTPAENADDDDGMIWAPPPLSLSSDREATPSEREAMLERLDNLLVVPPELEERGEEEEDPRETHNDNNNNNHDGQFDDADDDPIL